MSRSQHLYRRRSPTCKKATMPSARANPIRVSSAKLWPTCFWTINTRIRRSSSRLFTVLMQFIVLGGQKSPHDREDATYCQLKKQGSNFNSIMSSQIKENHQSIYANLRLETFHCCKFNVIHQVCSETPCLSWLFVTRMVKLNANFVRETFKE